MNASQAERLTALIEEEILSLKLRPGCRLDETGLAERYGTSRTPVREALRQLAASGLVEIERHKGAVVAKLGIRELVELLEVMAELEGACGRLAAKNGLKEDLEAIQEALLLCRHHASTNDCRGYRLANEAFHEAIYEASRNRCLISLTRSTRKRVAAYRRAQLYRPDGIKSSLEGHGRIAEAIELGLAEETDRLLQLHILNIGTDLRRLVGAFSPAELPTSSASGSRLKAQT